MESCRGQNTLALLFGIKLVPHTIEKSKAMIEFQKIKFRKLLLSDLDLMLKWLNTDFVQKWYDKKEY